MIPKSEQRWSEVSQNLLQEELENYSWGLTFEKINEVNITYISYIVWIFFQFTYRKPKVVPYVAKMTDDFSHLVYV